jgi:hypothetical protein
MRVGLDVQQLIYWQGRRVCDAFVGYRASIDLEDHLHLLPLSTIMSLSPMALQLLGFFSNAWSFVIADFEVHDE